jgi:hypothetical protein
LFGGGVFFRKSAKSAVSDLREGTNGTLSLDVATLVPSGDVFLKKSASSAAEERLRGACFRSTSETLPCPPELVGGDTGISRASTPGLFRVPGEVVLLWNTSSTIAGEADRASVGLTLSGGPSTGRLFGSEPFALPGLTCIRGGEDALACSAQGGSDRRSSLGFCFCAVDEPGNELSSPSSSDSSRSRGTIFGERLASGEPAGEADVFFNRLLFDREKVELCRPNGEPVAGILLTATGGTALTRPRFALPLRQSG